MEFLWVFLWTTVDIFGALVLVMILLSTIAYLAEERPALAGFILLLFISFLTSLIIYWA